MINDKTITAKEGGVRLDAALLSCFPTTTRSFVREAIAEGSILVDGRRTAKGYKLKGGETLTITSLMEECDNLVEPCGVCPQPIFEDSALLAFDKPAGMPVQPLNCRETGTLMNAVTAKYPECQTVCRDAGGESPLMAGALHRIDADTSGLVLVARTTEDFIAMREQFAAQTVKKTYLALVEGAVAVGGTLENELVHDPTLPFCRMIDAKHNRLTHAQCAKLRAMRAVTQFKPIGQTTVENEERTLLEVTIFTGVTHQIRAQLALAGMHIINDRLYGAFAVEGQNGHCLHALAANFNHPRSGNAVEIRTSLPRWAAF